MRPVPRCRSRTAILTRSRPGSETAWPSTTSGSRVRDSVTTWSVTRPIARASPPLHGIARSATPRRPEPHGLAHPLGHLGPRDVLDRAAALEHELRCERLEVGEQQEIGDVAWGDRPVAVEPVPLRGVEGRHHDRVCRLDARGDRGAHHAVDVAVVGDVLRVAVVRAERDATRAVLGDEGQQRVQVARHRGLADEEPHARAEPLAPLLDREHLVVRADPGGDVRLELLAEDAGRVTVHVLRPLEPELLELGRARPRSRPGSSSSRPARAPGSGASAPRGRRPRADAAATRRRTRARTTRP